MLCFLFPNPRCGCLFLPVSRLFQVAIRTSKPAAQTGAAMHPDLEKTVSRRSRSNVPDEALLASEADAELLGQQFKASKKEGLLTACCSQARVQARASTKLHLDRGLRYSLQYYGTSTFDRIHTLVLNSGWARRHGLGLVPGLYVHIRRGLGNGRFGKCYANLRWFILVV